MKKILVLVLAGVMLFSTCVFAEEKAVSEETLLLEKKEMEITWKVEGNGYYEVHMYNNTERNLVVELYKESVKKENFLFSHERRYSGEHSFVCGETPLEDGTYKLVIYSDSGEKLSGKIHYRLLDDYSKMNSTPPDGFYDMHENSIEAYELKKLGIMNGDPDSNMRLDDFLTRAEAVSLITRLHKLYDKEVENQPLEFADMESHWAYDEVAYAKNAELIDGTAELAFEPERNVTYSEFLKMALTVLGYDAMAEEMGGYPSGYIMTAANMSVIDGMNFRIDDNVTRGMAAKMLLNVVDLPVMVEIKTEGSKRYVIMNGKPDGEYISFRTMTENK